VEAYLALGNLFREKGQIERAIDIHKSLLHRPGLSDLGRTQALFSLALDFKSAGLIDRSERTLQDVVNRDPDNLSGWLCLRRVYEEMGRWEEAGETQSRIDKLAGSTDERLLASLWTERGDSGRRSLCKGFGSPPSLLACAACFRAPASRTRRP
jgi:lipopolysaccharide biosynthesis regulator YciM